ncbi:uncharacterized protein LOC113640468 isoform X2 [Tachysurus fulvidraco]|uniref:uncharacterized protein LOC113640468 isoform X2 n=1 Tax=Tachysurus fulvidraco TaxID=1234273 RepID=UPI001FEE80B9|nr:uncharacterized protein LOC113640468 isoform X2 [Tachysurus fulvidraco]
MYIKLSCLCVFFFLFISSLFIKSHTVDSFRLQFSSGQDHRWVWFKVLGYDGSRSTMLRTHATLLLVSVRKRDRAEEREYLCTLHTVAYSMAQKELEKISLELHKMTIHRDQLIHRLHLLDMLKEFRQKAGYTAEAEPDEGDEYGRIEQELKQISERKLELQALQEELEGGATQRGCNVSETHKQDPCGNEIFTVEMPPSYPAPQVITDINKLPRHPSQIQCPHCEQYVTTETSTVVGNTSWLICLVCTFMGCIAGCCLFPFCISGFRDVQHRCPKCRSLIHTCTNM